VNVKDYGALGDDSTNDATAIQAAFDAAFGSSGSPHGTTNAHLNRPVFFPNGVYRVGSTLNLTNVAGGMIFGSGTRATQLTYTGSVPGGGTLTALIRSNGLANCSMSSMRLNINGTNTCALDLNWDGSVSAGLEGNTFQAMDFVYSVVVARSGNGGHGNTFVNCYFYTNNSTNAGLDIRGSAATGNVVIGGGGIAAGSGANNYKISAGSLSINGISAEADTDYMLSMSGGVVSLNGVRTEQANFLKVSGGQLSVRAGDHTVEGNFANITGGKVIIDASNFNFFNTGNSLIIGNGGSLYLRGNAVNAGYHSTYTGTVVNEI